MKHGALSNIAAVLAIVGALSVYASPVAAADPDYFYNPRTTYGEAGMLDLPSARMDPDGQLFLTVGALKGAQRYNIAFQALPWLQASFRYSRISKIFGFSAEYDRSFGIKIRLVQESEYLPDITVGIRDILGTGIYAAEYFAATKRVSDFDLTAGLGWGRLADNETFPNVFGLIFPSFKTRAPSVGTGTVNFGQFFHGPKMGVFGGVIWHTPLEGLDLIAEYSSDTYKVESEFGAIKVRVPVNVGASYQVTDSIVLSAGWLYGTSYGATVSIAADPNVPVLPQKIGPELPRPIVRPAKQQVHALNVLFDGRRIASGSVSSLPWVAIPTSPEDGDKLAIASALMSEEVGVRDIDLQTKTLVVDAKLTQSPGTQCNRYAQLVSGVSTQVETLAVSDLSDRSGRVAVCTVGARPRLAQNSSAGEAASDSHGPDAALAAEDRIRADVAAQQIGIEALSVESSAVWIYLKNRQYGFETDAAGRVARILMNDAPPDVEIFHIIIVKDGMAMRDFQVSRDALERAATTDGTSFEAGDAIAVTLPPLSNPILEKAFEQTYPRLSWRIGPGLREGLFDPDRPIEVQILAALTAAVQITPGLSIEGRGEYNLYNNFNLNRASNSQLPHVRSDIDLYIKKGASGIANLDAVYRMRAAPDIYVEAKAGYLESMFAGGGLQVLWRPDGQRLAFGADLYEVWQRDFTRMFGVQDYHVLTGHATIYYASPWYGLNFAVHAGRYLAGDYGATIEVTRRFETGVEIGAFATFTNVPFSVFGEGSFDKGLIVHIPLEWGLPFHTQSTYDLLLRSLTRDGGQRLIDDDSLYGETLSTSYGVVSGHLDDIINP